MKTTISLVFAIIALFLNGKVLNAQSIGSAVIANDEVSLMDTLQQKYETKTIYLDGSFYEYTKNNREYKVGFFGKKLQKELTNSSEETQGEIAKGIKKKRRGTFLASAGGVIVITAFIAAPVLTAPIFIGMALGGLVPFTLGSLDLQESQDHLQKSIWLHNRDVLKQ